MGGWRPARRGPTPSRTTEIHGEPGLSSSSNRSSTHSRGRAEGDMLPARCDRGVGFARGAPGQDALLPDWPVSGARAPNRADDGQAGGRSLRRVHITRAPLPVMAPRSCPAGSRCLPLRGAIADRQAASVCRGVDAVTSDAKAPCNVEAPKRQTDVVGEPASQETCRRPDDYWTRSRDFIRTTTYGFHVEMT